jgi:hypothetical protein
LPPNYLTVRYNSHLRSVHHVERHEVFTNPCAIFAEGPDEEWPMHYLLHRGPTMFPSHPTPNGPRVLQVARVWCLQDTLLTSASIRDALTATEMREKLIGNGGAIVAPVVAVHGGALAKVAVHSTHVSVEASSGPHGSVRRSAAQS